jgi:hypothetical protein
MERACVCGRCGARAAQEVPSRTYEVCACGARRRWIGQRMHAILLTALLSIALVHAGDDFRQCRVSISRGASEAASRDITVGDANAAASLASAFGLDDAR